MARAFFPKTLLMSSTSRISRHHALPVSINQGFIAMLSNPEMSSYYAELVLSQHADDSVASGTTFQEISKTNFRTIEMLVPPASLAAIYTKQIEPNYDKWLRTSLNPPPRQSRDTPCPSSSLVNFGEGLSEGCLVRPVRNPTMTTNKELGRLKRVKLRDAWKRKPAISPHSLQARRTSRW